MKKIVHRRKFLALCGGVLSGMAAGLVRNPDILQMDRLEPPDEMVNGKTINYPLDDSIEVSDDESEITFTSPEVRFELSTFNEEDHTDNDSILVSRDLSEDKPTVWISPLHDRGRQYQFHMFANKAFKDAGNYALLHAEELINIGPISVTWKPIEEVYYCSVFVRPAAPIGLYHEKLQYEPDADVDVGGVRISAALEHDSNKKVYGTDEDIQRTNNTV